MNLVKYNPVWSGKNGLNAIVDDFFNRSLSDVIGSDFVMSRPSVNVRELENEFVIELAAPGLEKDNFDIKVERDSLVISATSETNTEDKGENYTRREFNYSTFSRRFTLPEHVDMDNISAGYENGILNIHLPKTDEIKNDDVRRIQIL